ncbi:MAG: two-component regulator propeller domain-containing protein [Dehalococcoidales bacterium]|nr:two-component regulator propeller domain-containing protein [Dehalococcoidales bacterium]
MNNYTSHLKIKLLQFVLLIMFISLFLTLSSIPCGVVEATSALDEQKLVFSKLEKNSLLSNNTIYVIIQDSYGYMWFGGRAGLFKYDGIKVKKIEIPGNGTIRALFEDSNGKLWIGTEVGLYVYEYRTKKVDGYLNNREDPRSISSDSIWSICEDNNGVLWIGTNNGLNSFDRETGTFMAYMNNPNDITSISDNMIRVLYKDNIGTLWIGTNKGMNALGEKYGEFISYNDKLITNGDNTIWDIYEDSIGTLWIGTNEGLYSFDRETEIFAQYTSDPDNVNSISNNIVFDIYEESNGTLWIGTNEGLNLLNRATGNFTSYTNSKDEPDSIGNNIIRAIYLGTQDILWIGTRAGVYYVDPQKQHLNYYDKVIKDIGVRAIDISGDISILGTSSGIFWFNYNKCEVERYLSYDSISNIRNAITESIYIDPNGILWVGTDHIGLLKIDIKTGEYKIYSHDINNPNSIIDGWITSLCYSTEEKLLWIGTNNGFCSFNYKENLFTRYDYGNFDTSSFSGININVIYCAKDGTIWIGTNEGLFSFDNNSGEFIYYIEEPHSQADFITSQVECIYEDNNNRLWIGTVDGLFCYNTQTSNFNLYTEEEGLPENHILGIIEDNEGNIWLTTNYSLSKFSHESNIITNYSYDYGLRGNVNYRNSIAKNPEGYIFIGFPNGLYSFQPEQIKPSLPFSSLLIDDFYLLNGKSISFNKSIEELEKIILNYEDNSFMIDFVALDYVSQHAGKYAYKLEGFESTWQYCDPEDSFAKYINIPKGEYNFMVMASNSDGIWITEGPDLKIIINPPFWQQWWFVLFLISIVLLAVVAVNKIINQTLHRHAQRLEMQVVQRTEQLNNKAIELQKEIKLHERTEKKLADEIDNRIKYTRALVHELKTPLNPLVAASDYLAANIQREPLLSFAKSVNTSAIKLSSKIDILLDIARMEVGILKLEYSSVDIQALLSEVYNYAKIEAEKNELNLFLEIATDLPVIQCDEERIKQAILNLLNNAFKYTSRDGTIIIKAKKTKNIVISVIDNGCGIDEEEKKYIFKPYSRLNSERNRLSGLGIGLSLVKQTIELHNGRIWFKSQKGKGSIFSFYIPVKPPDDCNNTQE